MFLKNSSRRKSSSQKVYNFFFSTDFLKKDLHLNIHWQKDRIDTCYPKYFPCSCSKSLISRKENQSIRNSTPTNEISDIVTMMLDTQISWLIVASCKEANLLPVHKIKEFVQNKFSSGHLLFYIFLMLCYIMLYSYFDPLFLRYTLSGKKASEI